MCIRAMCHLDRISELSLILRRVEVGRGQALDGHLGVDLHLLNFALGFEQAGDGGAVDWNVRGVGLGSEKAVLWCACEGRMSESKRATNIRTFNQRGAGPSSSFRCRLSVICCHPPRKERKVLALPGLCR